jgi:hypothetical protein
MIDIHIWKDDYRCVFNSALHLALVYADEMPTCFPDAPIDDPEQYDVYMEAIATSESIIRGVLKTDILEDNHIVPITHAFESIYELLRDTECSEATALTPAAYGLPPQWSIPTYLNKLNSVIAILIAAAPQPE